MISSKISLILFSDISVHQVQVNKSAIRFGKSVLKKNKYRKQGKTSNSLRKNMEKISEKVVKSGLLLKKMPHPFYIQNMNDTQYLKLY